MTSASHRPDETVPLLLVSADEPCKDELATTVKSRCSILRRVCYPILVLEMCLWIALATITGSLPIYFRKYLGVDSVRATEVSNALQAVTNLTPIVGGFIADQHLGRFTTITLACIIFTVGLALCSVATHPAVASLPLLLLGLFGGTAIAGGGTAPNLVVLGADQFDVSIPSQRDEKESFFNWYYWSINIGSFASFLVLANLAANGYPPYVPEEFGFFAAFGISTLAFIVGSFVFYRGKRHFRRVPPTGSDANKCFAVLLEAATRSRRGILVLSGALALVPGITLTTVSYFVLGSSWHMALALGGSACVVFGMVVLVIAGQSTEWVTLASAANGGSFPDTQVRDVRQVLRLMPFMSIIVIFWAAYAQMESNFLLQGCQMDLRMRAREGDATSPASLMSSATLTILDAGSVLLFIPVFDRLVYPFLSTIGCHPTMLRKVGAGLVFSFLAMLVAGWLEQERKRRAFVGGGVSSNCASGSEALPMSAINVWWQTPQYVLIGLSEILTSITSYDLFYAEAPESMRSACQSINLLTTTLGYIVAGALNSIFSFWVTTDLNDGQLENIFFVMAALVLVNLAAFVHISRSYEYLSPPEPRADAITGLSPAVARAMRAIFRRQKTSTLQTARHTSMQSVGEAHVREGW